MTTQPELNYERVGDPEYAYFMEPNVNGNLALTILPGPGGGDPSYGFKKVTVTPPPPPPPPPSGNFLPTPAGWKVAFEFDFAGLTQLPSGIWSYSGAPGGTSNCLWNKSQISFDADGLVFTTIWNGSDWLSAGVGTNQGVVAPFWMIVKEKTDDANVVGLNDVNLAWGASPSTWPTNVEVDGFERQCNSNGWGAATGRFHYGSNNTTTSPLTEPSPEDFNWHYNGFQVTNTEFSQWIDGTQVASGPVPSSIDTPLDSILHWFGVQTQTYNAGNRTGKSVRHIASMQVLVPA